MGKRTNSVRITKIIQIKHNPVVILTKIVAKILTKIPDVENLGKILSKIPVVNRAKILTKIPVVILTKILAKILTKIPVVIVTKILIKI